MSSAIAGSRPDVGSSRSSSSAPRHSASSIASLVRVPLDRRLDVPAQLEIELAQVLLLEIAAPPRVERSREGDDLSDGHVVVEILLVADEGAAPANLDAAAAVGGRESEDAGFTTRRPRHAEQDLHRRRLAGAVPAEKAEDRSRRHLQVEPSQRFDIVIALPQARRFDHRRDHSPRLPPLRLTPASSASTRRRISSSVTPRARSFSIALATVGLRRAQLVGVLLRRRLVRDECAGALPQLDDALVLQLAIRLRDRVGIDDQLLGQGPDARQLLARAQGRRFRWRASPAPSAGGRWERPTRDWVLVRSLLSFRRSAP